MASEVRKLIFDEKTKKREVLEFIGERSLERKSTTYRRLTREFLISRDAACSHLKRLWRDRLIRSTDYRSNYLEAMRGGKSIRDFEFLISRRGVERLEEWKRQDQEDQWA